MSAERRLQHLCQHLLNGQKVEPSIHQFFLSRSRQEFSNLNSSSPPVVIGGMVLDIHANPSSTARAGTTTPGKVSFVKGGVARNVAECMAKLGSKPFIISIVGTDVAGDMLLEHWKSLGLSTEGILRCEGIATPVVSNIFDPKGEIAAAVASVDALEMFLTPEWISRFEKNISSAPVVMVDANLNPLSLKAACQYNQIGKMGIPAGRLTGFAWTVLLYRDKFNKDNQGFEGYCFLEREHANRYWFFPDISRLDQLFFHY